MAIGNLQIIDIGLQNESAGSDSLYLAFNKTKNNFAILANTASQYVTFTGNTGIGVNANATSGAVDITNTGVTSLTAGSGVTISANTGNITISTTGSNGGSGTVTSVGVTSSTLTVTNSPIVGAGNIVLDLPTTGVVASQYTNPTVTVDTYGRITNIANNTVSGTVTSVSITPGTGIQVTTSGVPNVNPGFTIINTGVTRISQGSGIQVSSGNGNVTISTTPVAAVTSVSVASTSLTVTGSPITGSGTITVDLANTISISGNITGGNLITAGNAVVGGIKTNNYYYANGAPLDMQQPAGSNTQIQFNNANDFGASANLTFDTTTNTLSATTIAGTLSTAAQPNITSTGTLASLSVTANANIGNIGTAGLITATGNISGGNLNSTGVLSLNSSEDLADAAAANLQVTASYFTTLAAETATLAAGTAGQIKTFMMNGTSGDMVITVTNPGWGGAGTMTFSAIGDGCTLQYINSKWFCIGNNGVVFA